uniref:Uncharacterized protein n=1 Tax=Anguilla anguilla TaxID=7936 RepID=A0A0E9QJ60_ANGAN
MIRQWTGVRFFPKFISFSFIVVIGL